MRSILARSACLILPRAIASHDYVSKFVPTYRDVAASLLGWRFLRLEDWRPARHLAFHERLQGLWRTVSAIWNLRAEISKSLARCLVVERLRQRDSQL